MIQKKRMKRGNCLLSSSVSLCLFPAINHSPLVSFFLFSSPSSPSFQWQEKRERERMNISPFVQRWRLSLHSLFSRTSSAPSSVQLLCLHPTLHYFFSCLFSLSLHTLLFNTLVLFLFTLVSFPLFLFLGKKWVCHLYLCTKAVKRLVLNNGNWKWHYASREETRRDNSRETTIYLK